MRYEAVLRNAAERGAAEQVRELEGLASRTRVVIARSMADTSNLAHGTNRLCATYYQQVEAGMRVEEGSRWDRLRPIADIMLFGSYKDQIRFGTLSTDGMGLPHYGDCMWVAREEMIAHRTSAFEENSALFVERRRVFPPAEVPAGHRASWDERGKLCVAKLGDRVEQGATTEDLARLILSLGNGTGEDDDFVEAHIGGPMTILSFERILVGRKMKKVDERALRDKLANLDQSDKKFKVKLEIRPWT